MSKKIEKLEALLKMMNESLTKEDFTNAFKALTTFIKNVRDGLDLRFNKLEAKINAKVSLLKDGKDGKDGADGKDGINGTKGDKGDKGEKGDSIQGLNGADGSPDTPEIIRDKLEVLEGDEELKLESIEKLKKRIDELEERPLGGKGGGGFSKAHLEMKMIDNETPSGTINGVTTDFTLANIPNPPESLQVFRGGALQSVTEDYTLSSKTLTFIIPPVVGEVLRVYYRK